MALVLDTGPIVALLDAADPEHESCVRLVEELGEDLIIPAPVLTEVNYWLVKLYGMPAWEAFVEDVARGAYLLHSLDAAAVARCAELESRYQDLDLGFVDASVVITCEDLREEKVMTLDRRDFSVVRPAHCEALHLLPE